MCVLVKRILCKHGGKGRKKSVCQRPMGRFQQRKDKQIVQSECTKTGSKFKKQLKEPEHHKIINLLTTGKDEGRGTKINPFRSIARGDLTEEAKVWFYFISSILRASKHQSTFGREEEILLYALLKGYKINVGKMIENSILGYFESKCREMIPHPATTTSLCIQGGVKKEWWIKESYPRASPPTLTSITKGLKNRGKGK